MKKKITALALAAVMFLSLAACTENTDNIANNAATTDPLTKDDVIQLAFPSHASWPYRDDWKVWEYIEEACGATLDITAYPSSESGTKIPLMFAAPDTLVDAIGMSGKSTSEKYVKQGGVVPLDDVEQYMPNYIKWRDSLSEEERMNLVDARKAADTKVYYAPAAGREDFQNVWAWLYRKDIFEKHGLDVPETYDELYEVCKKLKELYPDSYPLSFRQGLKNLDVAGSAWKAYWKTGVYYDYDAETWHYGPAEDIAYDIISWYRKMHEEKLIPTDFFTMNATSWQELMTTDRGFITLDYETRIDFFNSLASGKYPGYDLHAMIPPAANKETGTNKINKHNQETMGYILCNTGDERRIANGAKFLDWFYSDEAVSVVSWGKEGETYEVKDGKKQYILDEAGTQPNALYGFGTYGTFLRMDPEAVAAFNSEDLLETHDIVIEHVLPYINPLTNLSYNEEEQAIIDNYVTSLNTYTNEMLVKFIYGQEPMSKFDEFQETLKNDMNLQNVMDMYKSAHQRMFGDIK